MSETAKCPRCGTVGCVSNMPASVRVNTPEAQIHDDLADIACSLRAIVARMPTGIGVQTAILNQHPVYRPPCTCPSANQTTAGCPQHGVR